MKQAVDRVDPSPLNPRRWLLTLRCRHEVWVTRSGRPRARSHDCTACDARLGQKVPLKTPLPRSADACPVRGCGALVPGVDTGEMFEGVAFECSGPDRHVLSVVVEGEKARLAYTGLRARAQASADGPRKSKRSKR